jgi:isopenicillin-N epimerase
VNESFWLERRGEMMLDARIVNFNAGTLSPTPRPVFEAATKLRQMQASNPSDFHWRQVATLLTRSRQRLAEYLRCRSDDLLLLPNVTFAVNLVVQSLRVPAGSEVLMTDHEYGAMLYCWQREAAKQNWKITQMPLPYRTEDPEEIVEAFRRAMTNETRIIFFSHCTTTTGLVLPAKRIAQLGRERGITVVIDGAHAPGMVPLDLTDIGADFYGANCHKWLMSPSGAGFLHVDARHHATLEPLITSWGWEFDRSKLEDDSAWGGSFWQRNIEFNGTTDRTPQMVLPESMEFRESLDGDRAIVERYRHLGAYARQRLTTCGFASATPSNATLSGCIQSFDFPCDDPIRIRDAMYFDHGIECPVTVAGKETFLRVSCAWFNTIDEIDRLAEAARVLGRRN